MRAVRCDVCGSRAMTAAAQCPTCSHHFELRDGSGNLFPLAYCSSCQSYYRESLGECRWCHTKPERPPIGPNVWRGIGVAALIALVITARFLQDDGSLEPAIERAKVAAKVTTPPPLAEDTALASKLAIADTAPRPAIASTASASTDSVTKDSLPRAIGPTDVARVATAQQGAKGAPPPVAPPVAPPVTAPVAAPPTTGTAAARIAATKPAVTSSPKPAATIASKARRPATRWVSSVSRGWVTVRAGASKRSRLIASIGPNSRVQLGESRDGWRRIRAKGLTGWVEQHVEFRVATNR